MTIHYPNGKRLNHSSTFNQQTSELKKKATPITFSNRGMTFEAFINQTNSYYLERNMAVVHKKPTPVQIVSVDYPKRSAAVIKEAYFKEASTTDYNGVYQGYYLDFEAKETKNKTSFPLSNFHLHQIEHMKKCLKQQGVVFVLLWFSSLKRCFFLLSEYVIEYWEQQTHSRKSIPLSFIETHGKEIQLGAAPMIHYLPIVDDYILKGDLTHDK